MNTQMEMPTRRSYKFGTWNVLGLSGKKREVFSEIRRENMDVVVLTETKLFLEQEFGEEVFEGYIHLFSGKKKMYSGKRDKTAEHASGGVSILLKKEFSYGNIITREFPNGIVWKRGKENPERLIKAELKINGCPIVVIGVYWLDDNAENGDKNNFQKDLEDLVKSSRCELVILGDFNSRVGMDSRSDVVGRYGGYEKNDNGCRLIKLCKDLELKIQNTFFNHEDIHKYTWYDPQRHLRSLIDFCITRKNTSFFFEDVLACRWLECGTDHIFLEATFQRPVEDILHSNVLHSNDLSDILVSFPNYQTYKFSDKCLFNFPKYRTYLLYSERILNCYQRVLDELYCEHYKFNLSSTDCYQILEFVIHSASYKVLGPERKNNFLWDQEIRDLRESRQRRIEQFEINKLRSMLTASQFKDAKNKLRIGIMREHQWDEDLFCSVLIDCESEEDLKKYKNHVWDGICFEINNKDIYRRKKVAWNIVNDLKGQSPRLLKTNSELFVYKEYKKSWKQVPPADNFNSNFTNSSCDILNALDHLDDCNIPVPGGLTIKLLRYSSQQCMSLLVELINKIFCGEKIPEEINTMYCAPINEKPHELYIGQGFMHPIMRIMRQVLKNKLEKYASFEDNVLLMPVESDREATFVLRQILQKSATQKTSPLHFVFIDLLVCFLSIEHSMLYERLGNEGVPNSFIEMIKHLYAENNIKDTGSGSEYLSEGLTYDFSLSSTLLKIYMKEALNKWSTLCSSCSVETGNRQILFSFLSSDCKLVIVSEKDNTIYLLRELIFHLRYIKLNIISEDITHLGKENLTFFDSRNEINYTIEGKDIIYFHDSILQLDGKNTEEIQERILDTKEAIGILCSVARDEMITKKNKISIFNSIVRNILLHGCETWTIPNDLNIPIEKAELSYWKWCWENYPQTYKSQEIYNFLNVRKSVLQTISNLKSAWYCHIVGCKSKNAQWINAVLDWKPDGKFRKGRPNKQWIKGLEEKKLIKDVKQNYCWFCVALRDVNTTNQTENG